MDAVYLATMTGTSVGYGDLAPTKKSLQWFSICFIPFMVFSIRFAGSACRGPVLLATGQ